MKRIMVVGILAAILIMAFGVARARVTADATINEGAQLGSAYPEITQWPDLTADATINEGAQLGSAYPEITQWPDLKISADAGIVVTPEDIEKLWQVSLERGERPSAEGQLYLAFQLGGFRQYVTLTLSQPLSGSFVAPIERIDFIQEQWQVNVLHQDEIDQWVVSANADGTTRSIWHKRLLEDNGRVLKEEFLPTDAAGTKAIVEEIAVRFLPGVDTRKMTLVH